MHFSYLRVLKIIFHQSIILTKSILIMKKILYNAGIANGLYLVGFTQDYYLPLGNSKSEAAVVDNSINSLKMSFSIQGLSGKDVTTKSGQHFTELYFGNGYSYGDLGTPKLPAFKRLIQVPFGAEAVVNVIGYSEEIYSLKEMGINNLLYPVQPSPRKDWDLDKIPFEFNAKSYQTSLQTNQQQR